MKRNIWLGVLLATLVGTPEAKSQSTAPPGTNQFHAYHASWDEGGIQPWASIDGSLLQETNNTAAGTASKTEPKPTRINPLWADVPVLHRPSKPGNHAIPPSGPGYYSAIDWLRNDCRETSPPSPYPPFGLMPLSYFDVNWKFLDDPEKSWGWTDHLKRQPVGRNLLFTTGGSVWWRYMDETNARLSGVDQDYDLLRTRIYADLSWQDQARFYFEFIDSHRFGGNLAPLRIDQTRADILNAFVDIKLFETSERDWFTRLGRQEMMFGSQRLISALDWANTRRTFDGARFFSRTKESDLDVFWTQPVIPDPTRLDQVDGNQHFVGAWLTKRPTDTCTVDHYYLYLGNSAPAPQLGQPVPETHVHTFGTRYIGNVDQWQYDYEGMLQLGQQGADNIIAGAVTAGHGYHFSNLPMNPTAWLYYDWASGDDTPGTGSQKTFQPLFPFGHYYLGFADIVGRQNIHDINAHLNLYPAHWVTFTTQYHNYTLASSRDALYNPAGVASRQDATGAAGRNVGEEIDFLFNFHIGPHSDFLVGYSKLWSGRFIRDTGPGVSPELFYVQYGLRW